MQPPRPAQRAREHQHSCQLGWHAVGSASPGGSHLATNHRVSAEESRATCAQPGSWEQRQRGERQRRARRQQGGMHVGARVSGHPRDRQQPLHLRAHTTASRLPKAHALFAGQDLRQRGPKGTCESEERLFLLQMPFLTTQSACMWWNADPAPSCKATRPQACRPLPASANAATSNAL